MTQSIQFTGGPTSQAMYDATRKRRRTGRRKRDHSEDVTYLNITPMLDMMTIILVFLIQSFASSSSNVNVANLNLPHSTTHLNVQEALQLMVTSNAILVDQEVVAQLDVNSHIRTEDLPDGPNSYLVQPLYNALEKRAQYFKDVQEYGGAQFHGRVAIIADRSTAYRTLFKILYTAGRAEYGSFKLFVQKPE
ncbi:MAG: biopolymer transporter ExbD [Myxococcales bacterium]|nr:biopolymer transporter ExbD [Myxococcales bacterium]